MQRLGCYSTKKLPLGSGPCIWLHAASVGEVQAAKALIHSLNKKLPKARFVVTTMTIHGRKVAREQLPDKVTCLLAPLDVPGIVDRVLTVIAPDIYVCIETELWPLMLHKCSKRHIPTFLVNGRLSEKSCASYSRLPRFCADVLATFDHMAVITEADRERFLRLGAADAKVTVEGNVKYDLRLPPFVNDTREQCRQALFLSEDEQVFIAGSTHTGEEELLVPLYKNVLQEKKIVWLMVPRHLERIPALQKMLADNELHFETLSDIAGNGCRRSRIVLVDSWGKLANLYSVATYVFCGGSLVERGGHNIMEAALWDKAVLYGPSMSDFKDAVELLEPVGGGVQVRDASEMSDVLHQFIHNPADYRERCLRAGSVARAQQGAAQRQSGRLITAVTNRS